MNTNVYKSCFWLLAHILFEPSSLSAIRTEISPAVKGKEMDTNYLVDEQKCPMLNAAFNETLRHTAGPSTARTVLAPTNIGGKTLYPGARVLVPYRPSLFSADVFGPNVLDFDPHRFIRDPELVKNPAYRPFGGGSQHCPGRFLTRREVVGFVALALDRFDFDLSNHMEAKAQQHFPRLADNKPSAGIIAPVPGDDVVVSIRRRKADAA